MTHGEGRSALARLAVTYLCATGLVFGWIAPSSGQSFAETGRPYFRNFVSSEYDAHVWNSSAVEDDRGVLYVGNNDGLLEYDGVNWRLLVLPVRSHVRSLGKDTDGRVWVGGLGNLGFVAPDSVGRATFVSILHNVPAEAGPITVVDRTVPTADGIWFDCRGVLLRYRPDPGDPANGRVDFLTEFVRDGETFGVDGELFVWRPGEGLGRMVDGSFALLPQGARFAARPVRFVLERDPGTLLVGTARSGLFLVGDDGIAPFGEDADEILTRHAVTSGAALNRGRVAVGTRSSGVLVLDRDGRLLHHLDSSIGMQHDAVESVYTDRSGDLWLMLEKGITRLDADSPLSVFDGPLGLGDFALRVRRHEGRLYVGTISGLSVLDSGSGRFRAVPEIPNRVDWLLPVGDQILAATPSGVYGVGRRGVEAVRPSRDGDFAATLLVGSKADPDVVFVGHANGVGVLARTGGIWRDLGRLPQITRPVQTGTSLSDGSAWVVDEPGRAYRIRPVSTPVARLSDVSVEVFGPDDGLPELGASVYSVADRPYFTSFGGVVYGLDRSGRRMERVDLFEDLRTGYPLDWFGFHQDTDGRVWVALGNRGVSLALPAPDGTYRAVPGPLGRLGPVLVIEAWPEPDGVVWMTGPDGLIRFESHRSSALSDSHSVLFRRVVSGEDSLLYDGLGPIPRIELAHARNDLHIEYALPVLKGSSQYRTMLEGYDVGWSKWTSETARSYTNLPENDYTFRVQARDIDGNDAGEGRIEFAVLPPWQRTAWAYLLFGLTGLGLIWLLRRYEMSRLLLKHRLELQHVESRRLKDLDRVRTDFFANISHEFRTPLTLILGPVTDALDHGRDLTREQLAVLRRNGARLLRLINQILDLSKLEAGRMTLRASREDIVPFLSGLLYSFESVAERRGIELTFSTTRKSLPLLFERDRLEQVFLNLISNAIKFTADGGAVSVACGAPQDGRAVITVRDNGFGIPADRLPHVFDRYFQSGVSPALEKEGTGIGLALTKAIVELHAGEITVDSELGVGTTFTVRLPMDDRSDSDDAVESPDGKGVADLPDEDAPAGFIGIDPYDVTVGEGAADGRPIVLVVEDHPDVRSYLTSCLEGDYRVRGASDGSDGLDQARSLVPDLIVADVAMPTMDGYDLARALREDERTSHVPIIMLTARAAEADKLKGLETGVDDYLLKPFNPQELRLRVRNLIALREAARRRFSTATIIKASDVAATSVDQAFIERVVACLEAHIPDEDYTVERLSEDVGMSVSQLNRKLNALIDQPAGFLLRSLRLQRAADLLAKRAGSVSEIAFQVGFSSPTHFSTAFKRQFGMSPSAYRRDS